MKLKVILNRDGMARVQFNADMKDQQVSGWTCLNLFLDLLNTPQAQGFELKKWKLHREREKLNGYAKELSPVLEDGDQVTLYASKKPDA